MSIVLRYLARCGAYLITLLIAAVWIVGGLEIARPGRCSISASPRIGDAIIRSPARSRSRRVDRAVRPDCWSG